MHFETENDIIVAYLEGRISSSNAEEIQKELDETVADNPDKRLVVDASGLEYISSAGLRVLIQAARSQKERLIVREVSPPIYEIFDMTGFVDIFDVRKKLREFSIDGCEIVGRGAIGTVYRIDEDTIVKVYDIPDSIPMIENEQKMSKKAFLKGIPTAISYDVVRVGDKFGSVFELLRATTYNDLIRDNPDRKDEIVREYAHFMRQIHSVEMDRGDLPKAPSVFLESLDAIRDIIPVDIYDRLRELILGMKEDLHAVHGDIQMKNVMLSGNEPILIDMETLSTGDPVFDLQGLCVTYKLYGEDEPDNSEKFLGLSKELCDFIYEKGIEYYFDDRDQVSLDIIRKRIETVALVRFIHLVAVMDIGKQELKQIRTEHAIAHLKELLPEIDTLNIR